MIHVWAPIKLSSAKSFGLRHSISRLFSISYFGNTKSKMQGYMSPRETARLIADTCLDVKINMEGVKKVANIMYNCVKNKKYSLQSWCEHELNPKSMDKAAVEWVFVADTLNFSFWSADSEKCFVEYKGKQHSGYWSLAAALNRALDEGIPITDPSYYASISREDFLKVFRSDSEYDMPMLDERLEVLREAGKVLLQKYDGSFVNCIRHCEKSAQRLIKLVVNDFPSYRDMLEYNGKKVSFLKRVQILIADVWGCCEGQSYGEFSDIDTVTMFADYRIPQALVYFGALEYSDKLMDYMNRGEVMKTGDRYENEIRGCSIWVTELICEETKKMLAQDESLKSALMNSILIDHYLWDYRRELAEEEEMKKIPFHRIRCIYY
ncbi:hypothetical protein ScPMuIL_008310 [Solemya velum]